MSDTTYSPGAYTFKWMVDTRNVSGLQPLRIAQVAAYAVQPRHGQLAGNAVQPTDAEFIKNRLTNDTITGVIRLQLTSPQSKSSIEQTILTALRANGVPDAAKHLGGSEWGPGAAVAAPALALFTWPVAGIAALSGESGRQSVRNRIGDVIIDVKPRVDNAERPSIASGPLGLIANQASTRISADPSREGTVGAASVAEAAQRASDALTPPPWLIAVLVSVGAIAVAAVGFVVYKQVKAIG